MTIRLPMQIRSTLIATAAVLVVSGSAYAAPIAIVNASFETDVKPDGDFTNNTLTGWSIILNCGGGHCAGAVNPTSANYPTTPGDVPDGFNAAYTDGGAGGIISQILTTSILVGETYTLTYEVGNRDQGGPAFAPYTVELLAGGASLASSSTTVSGVAPLVGTWESGTIVYTGQAGDTGDLEIRITGTGQAQFDDFELSSGVIPEPNTALLALVSLLMVRFGVHARRM
jgi:hypothetical protein